MNRMYVSLLGALALALCSLSAFAEQIAEVGVYNDDGRIKLHADRFQTHFPDGTPVSELGVRISNGFVHLFRKGYDADQACRAELIELKDKNGFPLMQAAPQPVGTRVFIWSSSLINIAACLDDGCHALKYVVPLGDPPLLRAACDRTDLSENKCRCHINDGSGERLVNGDFCDSYLDEILRPVTYWVTLANVINI